MLPPLFLLRPSTDRRSPPFLSPLPSAAASASPALAPSFLGSWRGSVLTSKQRQSILFFHSPRPSPHSSWGEARSPVGRSVFRLFGPIVDSGGGRAAGHLAMLDPPPPQASRQTGPDHTTLSPPLVFSAKIYFPLIIVGVRAPPLLAAGFERWRTLKVRLSAADANEKTPFSSQAPTTTFFLTPGLFLTTLSFFFLPRGGEKSCGDSIPPPPTRTRQHLPGIPPPPLIASPPLPLHAIPSSPSL